MTAGTIDDSASLVPGDLIDLAYENLHTFPADVVLLSGDAIVNESMLTGESVPVSKVPIESGVVSLVSAPGGEIKADLSKHVLYNGTKIIRIRKTSPGGKGELEAVAMVLRTGGSQGTLEGLRNRNLNPPTLRLQHDQGRPRPLDALPQAVRVSRVLFQGTATLS